MTMSAPIAIIAFNRPVETSVLMASIAKVQPSRLFVIMDGPRDHVPEDVALCAQTLKVIEDAICWPAEVVKNISSTNLGCGRRVETALDWLFAHVDSAIILEDDCIPDPSFFQFCTDLLVKYADHPQIGSITGTNPLAGTLTEFPSHDTDSFLFSRYPLSWGWATWSRAWKLHDPEMSSWQARRKTTWLKERAIDPLAELYWRAVFDNGASEFDGWDYGWTYTSWENDLLAVHPVRNLISNIGFGSRATHTREWSRFGNMPTMATGSPLVFPSEILRDANYDRILEATFFSGQVSDLFGKIRTAIASQRSLGRRAQ